MGRGGARTLMRFWAGFPVTAGTGVEVPGPGGGGMSWHGAAHIVYAIQQRGVPLLSANLSCTQLKQDCMNMK